MPDGAEHDPPRPEQQIALDIGGGRGSLAVWLAEQVGSSGEVVATDVDTRYLERLDVPNLRVVRHDILEDPLDVLEPGSFDLVSSRLVLFWLADRREEAVARMVEPTSGDPSP